MPSPGLYIHIPFCLKKCGYCSFYSVTELELRNAFVSALLKEMELYRGFGEFDTVYFGGGTPSLLSSRQIEAIIRGIRDHFSVSADTEWSFEANPGDLTEPYCRSLMNLGFNRINIGVQSFDDDALKTLGRRHRRQDALDSMRFAAPRDSGISVSTAYMEFPDRMPDRASPGSRNSFNSRPSTSPATSSRSSRGRLFQLNTMRASIRNSIPRKNWICFCGFRNL